jgi:hypothetical protein
MSPRVDRAFARKLRKEIEVWDQEGLVSPIPKDRILARYQMKAGKEGGEEGGGDALNVFLAAFRLTIRNSQFPVP